MSWFKSNWFLSDWYANNWFVGSAIVPGTCANNWWGNNWFVGQWWKNNWFHGLCNVIPPLPVVASSGRNPDQLRDDFFETENEEVLLFHVL